VFKGRQVAVDPTTYDAVGFKNYVETDGLLGFSRIRSDRVWISFNTGALFVQRAPAPPKK